MAFVTQTTKEQLYAWLDDRGLLAPFAAYEVQDEATFPRNAFGPLRTKMLPAVFWRWVQHSAGDMTDPVRDLLALFETVHLCPASSASIERDFSLYGRIQSKLRSRLGTAKVAKMVKVVRTLRADWEQEGVDDLDGAEAEDVIVVE